MPSLSLPKAGSLNVPQAVANALRAHEQGRLAEAEQLYLQILAVRPDHFDALQMLALIKLAKGQPAEALRLVSAAMNLRTPSPQVLLNHGLILNALERREEALGSFDRAIKLKSKFAEAYSNRGAVLSAVGRNEEAAESCRKAIAIKPAYAEAHYNLGTALRALGRGEEAIKSFDHALALQPKYAKAHNNRGAALEALNRLEEALASYQAALAIAPGFAEARTNRSRVQTALGRFDDALQSADAYIALRPDDADGYLERGKLLVDLNRIDDAEQDFQKGLALRPQHAETRFADCIGALPILYADEGEIARRRETYERKLRALCADAEAGKLTGDLDKAIVARMPFLLAYQGASDRELQSLYGALIHRIVARRDAPPALPPPPAPGEPIRVGFVSSHFFLHSNWKIPIKGWLSQLDRMRFKIFGYHLGTKRDAETEAAAALCDRFVHRILDVAGWRREILSDAPHVLIYPGLLMDNFSLPLAAQRLAPVQITSWGHPETSGLPTLDYYLSSDLMEPADGAAHYTEELVRLANLSIYYEPVAVEPMAVTRAELGLRGDAAVFWCGQSLYKYLPQHDAVFARIAQAAPQSQFVFLRHNGAPLVNELFQRRLERTFAALGLRATDHCVHLGRLSQSKFVAAIGLADVFLDSIGWSGCNSALESLPRDKPIVTTAGALMRGRHSAAILRMMDVTGTIADTLDRYVDIAARLANDPAERQAVARAMAENKHKVYRDRACISDLEALLERAARNSATSQR